MGNELEKFGKHLAELRTKHNLTQEKLAEMIGYSTNHISKLELAKAKPSFELLVKIAIKLNIELKDLFNFQKDTTIDELRQILQKIIDVAQKEDLDLIYNIYKIVKINGY